MVSHGITYMHTVSVCRYLVWINGPRNATSVMWMNLDTKERSTADLALYDILDLSIAFNNDIIVVTEGGLLLSLTLITGLITQLFQFGDTKPIALDIFGIYSYLVLDNGSIVQINNQKTEECKDTQLAAWSFVKLC